MAFPTDVVIECAFNNDFSETDYAQSGWTDITPFVRSFSGTLRGRSYERDQTESGTLSVTLDNSDSRFLPGSVQSPYYPFVKSSRRFRIRGKNMLHPNVARSGSRDRDVTGFIDMTEQTQLLTANANYSYGAVAMDSVRIITASAEPNAGIGQGKERVNDGLPSTMWTINTQAGWLTYQLAIGVQMKRYTLQVPAGNATRNPASWTLQGSNNGSTWTTIHTVTGNTWTEDYEKQEFTITSPGFYLYYKLDITANVGAVSNTQLTEWTLNYDSGADLQTIDDDIDHYIEVTMPANQTGLSQWHRTLAWFVPLEYGVRIAHSVYVWKISGTEPTGTQVKTVVTYYDSDWNVVSLACACDPGFAYIGSPTLPVTPAQFGWAHTPPSNAKYGVVSFQVWIPATTNTTDLIYGVTALQSELNANLAPDIQGYRDTYNWQMESQATTPGTFVSVGTSPTAYLSTTWAVGDANLYITIPHLIPGETYTATVEAQKVGTEPDVLFSGDEGETGALINTTTMTQYTISFEATRPEQELRFILQGTPTGVEGLRIRKLNVQFGDNPSLALATDATQSLTTAWTRPKDIFEGWVESWPAVAGSLDMTVTVSDRMKKVGSIELANTLKESLLQDTPALLMPLTDSLIDTPGRFSQLGYWGDVEGGPASVDISKTRGDIGTSSYTTQTDDGPTGEASLKLTPGNQANLGYMMRIPYSKDFTTTTPGTGTTGPKPPPSKPKPTETTRYTYTKKWNATWSRSYDGSDATRFDDSDYMYQGQFGGANGIQKSLAGFDYKNIQATLKGAEILEVYFTVKNAHARWNKGLYVFLGYHNYASKPSTWSGGSISERKVKKWVTEGDSVTANVGASVGRWLRDNTVKGLSIGPDSNSDNYGYFYGAKQSGRPYITIKYRK